ncbi:unnamed protein product [Sphagnum tenellum]
MLELSMQVLDHLRENRDPEGQGLRRQAVQQGQRGHQQEAEEGAEGEVKLGQTMRDLRHDNLNSFVGACVDTNNVCIITEYCTRGSLRDLLDNEDVKLDRMFIASLVGDVIRGMTFIHDSALRFHANLKSTNCLVDSRWVLKISDFGLHVKSPDMLQINFDIYSMTHKE